MSTNSEAGRIFGGGTHFLKAGTKKALSTLWYHGHQRSRSSLPRTHQACGDAEPFGGVTGFNGNGHANLEEISIAPKELLPILLASATLGKVWRGEIVLFRCDNQTVVSALAQSSSRDKIVMQLLRVLHFAAAFYSFTWVSTHIPGVTNVEADALSRDSMPKNQCLSLQFNEQPAAIPLQFLELLLSPHLDWSSHTWRRRLAVSLRQA